MVETGECKREAQRGQMRCFHYATNCISDERGRQWSVVSGQLCVSLTAIDRLLLLLLGASRDTWACLHLQCINIITDTALSCPSSITYNASLGLTCSSYSHAALIDLWRSCWLLTSCLIPLSSPFTFWVDLKSRDISLDKGFECVRSQSFSYRVTWPYSQYIETAIPQLDMGWVQGRSDEGGYWYLYPPQEKNQPK